jgi:hypothetical protein
VARNLFDHAAKFGVGGIAASQLRRYACRESAHFSKRGIVFGDEGILYVMP